MARMDRVNSVAKKIESLLGESGNDCLHDSRNAADIMLAEQDILIEILERVMEDKYKIIESFVLEQDFGRYEKYNKFIDSNISVKETFCIFDRCFVSLSFLQK